MLPSHLVQPDLDWKGFANAEQYKRYLIQATFLLVRDFFLFLFFPSFPNHLLPD